MQFTKTELPTVEELQSAITRAKEAPHNVTSTQIKTTDYGAGIVRFHLPDQFRGLPLDEIRIASTNLSRSGQEPGKRKRSDEQRESNMLTSLVRAFPRAKNKSQEYEDIHNSQKYRDVRDSLKRTLGFRCQACSRVFIGSSLEGHIVDYNKWEEPGMLLILCRDCCHPIIDALRRRGGQISRGEEVAPLFKGLGI